MFPCVAAMHPAVAMAIPPGQGIAGKTAEVFMRNPSQPDTQANEYMPDLPSAHKSTSPHPQPEGINPRDTSSMPRGEDDDKTRADSPEFHDRTDTPDAGTSPPPRQPL
jgi:hypothetical protein